jgi:hypothetical protein
MEAGQFLGEFIFYFLGDSSLFFLANEQDKGEDKGDSRRSGYPSAGPARPIGGTKYQRNDRKEKSKNPRISL